MKLDDNVKTVCKESTMLLSKATEMFINEFTLRSFVHTTNNRRLTLKRKDIAMALTEYDQFDFLIDIVPKEKYCPKTVTDLSAEQVCITRCAICLTIEF